MRGKFDRPPSATGYSCSSRQAEGPSPLRPRSQATAPVDGKTLLRPIFDLLLLAALLLPWKLWWYLAERECPNPSRAELVLLRVTRGVWIAWLTHAAGLLDEVVRVALGIRLTQGLGTPTSVDKVFSKMSRWAEVVAEGIAVDDFPALVGLYAGIPSQNKRASSGGVRGDASGIAAAQARVNRSLVMRVERAAATAQLSSLTPWSPVRRYDRVHLKGITLRLRQVNGILNFSFLALKKKGRRGRANSNASCRGTGEGSGGSATSSNWSSGDGRTSSSGGSKSRGNSAVMDGFAGAARSGGMEDLDGIDTDEEDSDDLDDDDEEDRGTNASSSTELSERTRRFSEAASDGSGRSLSSSRLLGFGARKFAAPCSTSVGKSGEQPIDQQDSYGNGGGIAGKTTSPRCNFPGAAGRAPLGERARSMSLSAHQRQPPETFHGGGNLGVFKVLGEAFMRRFNAYCQQVSAAFDRMGDIKLVPKLKAWQSDRKGAAAGRGPRRKKRFEVREILLEDVCICVDAGVWNDLLGDQVGAAFSPEFRLRIKIGPQELLTEEGEGRLASEIGMIVNDKLVRLLARLVMRETLKTSTLTSMVITSLALDTDARGRRQNKHQKSPNPGSVEEEDWERDDRGTLARAVAATSDAADVVFAAEAKAAETKPGKFWRSFGSSSSSTMAAVTFSGSAELSRSGTSSGSRGRTSLLPFGASACDGPWLGRGAGEAGAVGREEWAALPVRRRSRSQNGPRRKRASDSGGFADSSSGGGGGGGDRRNGSYASSEGGSESWRGRRALHPKRSLPIIGKPKGSSRRLSDSAAGEQGSVRSPPPPWRPPGRGRARGPADENRGDDGDSAKRWSAGGRRGRQATVGGGGGGGAQGADDKEGEDLETVARAPPWMDDVQASAEYEEMKPTLDVIKRTVLLAVLQQSNRSVDVSSSFSEGDLNARSNGRSWGRPRGGAQSRRDDFFDGKKELEKSMQEELMAAREAGTDVDRMVMKALLARVQDSGPNTAFKALASIELSSFIENLAAGTRFAQHLESVGIDVSHVARSLAGLTAGEMMEGVKDTAGKVGGQARRLRTEAARMHKELLDETGILPLLNDAGGGNDATSLACAVESLSETLTTAAGAGAGAATGAGGAASFGPSPIATDSWERGVAVSKDPWGVEHSVEKGLGGGGSRDVEEVDEVDVIMQVLDLLDAVESLKVGIMNGDGVALNKVEQAVGKVAGGIDVYLILAASESMLGFLLERLGKLPVGQAKFSGKGVESRVWNLDLQGVRVKRENVDLVMKGFRLPKRGTAVMTPLGPGKMKRYKKRTRCFVVNLDWTMGNGKPVRAYLQPNDIVVLEGHEGELSDEEGEENSRGAGSKVTTVDHNLTPSSDKPSGSRAEGEPNPTPLPPPASVPPHGDTNGVPPRADRGKWSSLTRLWNRRKSSGAVDCGSEARAPHHVDEASTTADEGGGSLTRSSGGRTLSAPVMIGPPSAKLWRKPRALDESACTSPSTATTSATLDDLQPNGFVVGGSDDGKGERGGGVDRNPCGAPSTRGSVDAPSSSSRTGAVGADADVDAAKGRCESGGRGSRCCIAGPTAVNDILSAPFLVARISGVGAELKGVMWSVKQTHFPHLKTSGSLEATVSGLTIELELDTQDQPHTRGVAATAATVGDCDDSSAEGSGHGSSAAAVGDTPKGLRLTRLRVSVRKVKVHVSNSALSAVYNLAASAFEAAVKRYVVESVEATVRKNLTALLSIVDKSEKWKILRKVGGGTGGGGGDPRSPCAREGNAVDKVLAASLSHHIVWAAGYGGNGNLGPAGTSASVKGAPPRVPDQRTEDPNSRADRLPSGCSRVSRPSTKASVG